MLDDFYIKVLKTLKINIQMITSCHRICFFLWICYISCMREAVYIFKGFRMRVPPSTLKTPSKLRFALGHFPQINFIFFLGTLEAMVPWCHNGAICPDTHKSKIMPKHTCTHTRTRILAAGGHT